ncbi:transposase [Citrobacter sp. CK197]|uniref:transposase n=1 Tax=Citrobacter sp. CK197 TaxID=2985106 RepID=UPI002578E274|nr:transposase [Citrobacter sp. CK197]MDM2983422.1 transposase [Citrobacter sp. CK197]
MKNLNILTRKGSSRGEAQKEQAVRSAKMLGVGAALLILSGCSTFNIGKDEERAQLSLLEGSEYDYFFFVTNTTLLSEKVVIYYEKRGNAENYIKEAKYDMAVGHLLLKSFWANEAVFQMMMLSYNLFLLFKFDSLDSSEYRQQIKTFRLKYVFLAAKIIKTARYVIMKLSENYPYKGVYEKCLV